MKNLLLLSLSSAFSLSGRIEAGEFPDWTVQDIAREALVHAVLANQSGSSYKAFVMPDGSFAFRSLPEGTYFISVISNLLSYPTMVADSLKLNRDLVESSVNDQISLENLVFHPTSRMKFFAPKQAFDVFQSLKSPMFLFSAGVIVLMAVLTRLQSSLGDDQDPNLAGRAAEIQVLVESTMTPFDFLKSD
jgi:hypothetical protein